MQRMGLPPRPTKLKTDLTFSPDTGAAVSPSTEKDFKSLVASQTLDRRSTSSHKKKGFHFRKITTDLASPLEPSSAPVMTQKSGSTDKEKGKGGPGQQRVCSAPTIVVQNGSEKKEIKIFSKIAILSSFFERKAGKAPVNIAPLPSLRNLARARSQDRK